MRLSCARASYALAATVLGVCMDTTVRDATDTHTLTVLAMTVIALVQAPA